MKLTPKTKQKIEKYKDYVLLVEGKKDIEALKQFDFEKVYAIHKNSVSLRERIEEISQQINKKDKVSILTDLDKTGNKLHMKIKPILQEQGVNIDSSFRGLLIKEKISHIEGISKFMTKVENIEQQ